MRLALIGYGEVGRRYASAFAATSGHTLDLCDVHKPAAAEEIPGTWHDGAGPWLRNKEAVLLCVNGGSSLPAARGALPFMSPGSLLADMTTAAPDDKRIAAEEAASRAISYVDAVILSPIALSGARTPLACAGPGANRFKELMTQVGAPVRVLTGRVGDAAALKLLRSIFMKGLEALAVESFAAAEHYGMRGELLESLSDLDEAGVRKMLEALVRSHLVHARRKRSEVEQARAQVARADFPTDLLAGIEASFARTCEDLGRDPVTAAPTFDAAVAWLLRNRRGAAGGSAAAAGAGHLDPVGEIGKNSRP